MYLTVELNYVEVDKAKMLSFFQFTWKCMQVYECPSSISNKSCV